MHIVGIDPGDVSSAVVVLWDTRVESAQQKPNDELLRYLMMYNKDGTILAIESIQSYGMAVGRSVFQTCIWIGRMVQIWVDGGGTQPHLVFRSDIKQHFCNAARAKDPNIRRVLLDRFGGDKAKGTKKNPGPLYGVSSHSWSALAVALYVYECALVSPSN